MASITPIAVVGMSRREAYDLDRQRLVLEATWHALESANIAPDRLDGSTTGVFVEGDGTAADRVARCFGLDDDTACPSAWDVVREACASLVAGKSLLAIAAGADGCVVVLKPLDAAVADGDVVLAVIRTTAIVRDPSAEMADLVEALAEEFVPAALSPDRLPKESQLLLTLSAHSATGLRALAGDYARLFETTSDAEALCRTANRSRARLSERLAVVGATEVELAAELRRVSGGDDSRVSRGRVEQRARVAFVFSGEGSQYLGMGGELYLAEPVFRRRFDECDEVLRHHLGVSVLDVVFGADAVLLNDLRFARPALVAVELALVELWRHWGVEPEFVAGHGVGEVVAATTGTADFASTLRLVAEGGTGGESGGGLHGAVRRLAELGADTFVEIGPEPDLTGLDVGTWVPSLRVRREDTGQIRESLGELFVRGVDVDLARLDDHRPGSLVAAPLYPFDREGHRFALLPGCPELETV